MNKNLLEIHLTYKETKRVSVYFSMKFLQKYIDNFYSRNLFNFILKIIRLRKNYYRIDKLMFNYIYT